MLPMGTIVTVCMLIGLLFAAPYVLKGKRTRLPAIISWAVGGVVFAAGAWNTFWHGLRHLTDFWGIAALISGIFLMLTALYIAPVKSVPDKLHQFRIVVVIGLLASFLLYAITIARL